MDEDLSRTAGAVGNGEAESDASPVPASAGDVNSTDATRLAILDAVVRCIAAQGWAGTNMSLVARETGMTRGKIQYYFPVLEDLKYAAIEHLHDQTRRSYFGQIAPNAPARAQFDQAIDLLWDMANDPYHLAMAEVGAAARTDAELRQRLSRIRVADDAALGREAEASFPALAAIGLDELHLGRLFTTVFINGLAAHNFPEDTALWQRRLIAMLKELLADFWIRRGAVGLHETGEGPSGTMPITPKAARSNGVEEQARAKEALALLKQAVSLLA